MIKRAIALSYSGMKDFIQNQPPANGQHGFISIIDKCGIRIFDQNSPRVITLFFDDVHPHQSLHTITDREFTMFSEEHACEIIEFITAFNAGDNDETMYVHCGAGIARSGAVVTFIKDIYGLDDVQFALDNPRIMPNAHILNTLKNCWQSQSRFT